MRRCRKCRYSIENLPEARCPECGAEFDFEDPATFVVDKQQGSAVGWLVASVVAVASSYFLTQSRSWLGLIGILGLCVNAGALVRGLFALMEPREAGDRHRWLVVLFICILHLIGCGGVFMVLQPVWTAQLQP